MGICESLYVKEVIVQCQWRQKGWNSKESTVQQLQGHKQDVHKRTEQLMVITLY